MISLGGLRCAIRAILSSLRPRCKLWSRARPWARLWASWGTIMRLRVIDRGFVSARLSQALWYGIAARMRAGDDPVLTLLNPVDPYVCTGFHQDVRLEVDQDYCVGHGIAVLRRRLGGGAVYLDRHQLIFHFMF